MYSVAYCSFFPQLLLSSQLSIKNGYESHAIQYKTSLYFSLVYQGFESSSQGGVNLFSIRVTFPPGSLFCLYYYLLLCLTDITYKASLDPSLLPQRTGSSSKWGLNLYVSRSHLQGLHYSCFSIVSYCLISMPLHKRLRWIPLYCLKGLETLLREA